MANDVSKHDHVLLEWQLHIKFFKIYFLIRLCKAAVRWFNWMTQILFEMIQARTET